MFVANISPSDAIFSTATAAEDKEESSISWAVPTATAGISCEQISCSSAHAVFGENRRRNRSGNRLARIDMRESTLDDGFPIVCILGAPSHSSSSTYATFFRSSAKRLLGSTVTVFELLVDTADTAFDVTAGIATSGVSVCSVSLTPDDEVEVCPLILEVFEAGAIDSPLSVSAAVSITFV